ncbi:hypothetical protein [Yonghaparkia sp. Root332]|uniref:hypothetical protein n=1 Tax=Yonghaparkia sp. Root332 TaxID=1736516 RepID=UPI0006F87DEA|nr:hypothetical protein [Yonghaparkia sp. Root332]KQV25447.1 hypothetical protein ASC54_00075 [Yonghaparkia sp. Root332]
MSTPLGPSLLVAAALAALLSGCAAPAPAAAPEAPATSATTPSAEPEPPAEFGCADLDDAMPAGFEEVDPFGSAPVLAAFAAGGSSCNWQPAAEGGAVSSIGVNILPAELLETTSIEPSCGELYDLSLGCSSRELIDGLAVETRIVGDTAAAETSSALEAIASAIRERLAEGARPLPADESSASRFDCQRVTLSAISMPESVGSFVGEFGGTDSGSPSSELTAVALISMAGMVGCLTATTSGFGVSMATLGGGAELLDDERIAGASTPLDLADGRGARILTGTWPAEGDGAVTEFARVVFEADGALVFLSVNDRGTPPDAAPIDEAAAAIAEAIATAIDARG